MQREEIHHISRHSNLKKEALAKALEEHVYNDKKAWKKFLNVFILSLGIGFTVAGVIFFFAYNWADLHKFVKLGLVEGILLLTMIPVLLRRIDVKTRKSILTGVSVLVGVLFAVYGQIYQTGANAYDFFLVWTVFITLWVIIADFAALWLLYLVLINVTFILYTQQVAPDWSTLTICLILFVTHLLIRITTGFLKNNSIPHWFNKVVSLAAVSYATIGMVSGIFEFYDPLIFGLLLIIAISYVMGVRYGVQSKSVFYVSIISFSILIIISALLLELSDQEAMFLMVSLFIVFGVLFTVKHMIDLQKKWANEK